MQMKEYILFHGEAKMQKNGFKNGYCVIHLKTFLFKKIFFEKSSYLKNTFLKQKLKKIVCFFFEKKLSFETNNFF